MLAYLSVQKQRGYSIIALEQATRSVSLEKFIFPKRCVLVLGNERLGMGSEVIELAEHLVEIPQFGKVRSLNVHVSSVMFLWSYQTSLNQ
jgi:tRNA guanosine-2'-O-methyltransferase